MDSVNQEIRSEDLARAEREEDVISGVGEIPDNDVWRRVYVLEGTDGPVRRAYITHDIFEEIQERQSVLNRVVNDLWEGSLYRRLPVMHDYRQRSLWMPLYVRVDLDEFVVGNHGPDGWSTDISPWSDYGFYNKHECVSAWFDRQLVGVYNGDHYKVPSEAVSEVLHEDDQELFEAFVEYVNGF